MIVTAKVRIECYLSKQKTHYTIYFRHEGCPPSQIFGLLFTNLSQKEKQRSFVVLYSFKVSLGAGGRGDDMWTGRKKKTRFAPETYIHRTDSQNAHREYLKHTDKYWTSSSAPLCKQHLSPMLLLESWWEATPSSYTWQRTQRQSSAVQMGLKAFAFSLLIWIAFTFCHCQACNLSHIYVCQKKICLELKTRGMIFPAYRPEIVTWSLTWPIISIKWNLNEYGTGIPTAFNARFVAYQLVCLCFSVCEM